MSCVEKIGKNPIAVRIVTNVVLMVSDADFIFSLLFMFSLFQTGQEDAMYLFFLMVVVLGVLVYFLGAVCIAPRQKHVIAKLVMKFLTDNPTECIAKDWYKNGASFKQVEPGHLVPDGMEVTICRASPVYPQNDGSQRNPKICDLDLSDPINREALRLGLAQWGLGEIWDAQERKNAWNCAEIKHGIPFFRLARFGFMSQPTPRDLGSILNMNALYSFATGAVQLIFGSVLLVTKFTSGDATPTSQIMMIVIPLGISTISLVLSIFNVVFDFAGKLADTECEKRMSDAILQKSAVELKNNKKKQERDHKRAIQKVEQDFREKLKVDPDSIKHGLWKDTEIQRLTQQYAMDTRTLDERNLTILEIELNGYRRKKNRVHQILMGKTVEVESQGKVDALQNAMEIKEVHQRIENQITAWYRDGLAALADELADGLSATEYQRKSEALSAEHESKMRIAKNGRERNFSAPVSTSQGESSGSLEREDKMRMAKDARERTEAYRYAAPGQKAA